MSEPCEVSNFCKNSPKNIGEVRAKCALCRLSPDNLERDMTEYWIPIKLAKDLRIKHPVLEERRRLIKALAHMEDLRAKYGRDKTKRKVSRLAAQAEKKTEKNIIRATKNSGRSNKDGDHVSMGVITLDTKLQTTRENPVIFLGELEKVRADAMRAGKLMGGLVIRNKNNVGCVVLKEEDYAELTRYFLEKKE